MGITGIENLTETVELTDTGEPIVSHMIGSTETQSASAIVTEARVNGTAVTALCGYTWVPSRNPDNHLVCQKCEEIFQFDKQFK